jgi:FtsP/CotA-like multicopper oxidase with cupredoxin domain
MRRYIMSNKFIALLAVAASVVIAASGVTYRNNQFALQLMNNNSYINPAKPQQNPMQGMGSMNTSNPNDITINNHDYAQNIVKPRDGQPVKNFTLTAKETDIKIKDGVSMAVWTYNGTVPGQEIRVVQGDFVKVELKNSLKEPVTIHWHGYPISSAMDGVPGFNQDAVKAGETFTYEFSADVAGTYWYHSHQESSRQVDKGLYGALIVLPKDQPKPDRDYTLILDEWMEKPVEEMGEMSGMDTSNNMSGDSVMEEEAMMAAAYDIYTVNGKSGAQIDPLATKKGETVRLRFINAGYRSHGIHIPGQNIKVVSTDGQNINGAGIIKDQILMIAPGERYDVEFTVTSEENFVIDAHDDNAYNDQIKIPVNVVDGSGTVREEALTAEYPLFYFVSYGTAAATQFSLNQSYDINYNVDLGTDISNGLKYTINGKVFSELPALKLKTGDMVKFTYFNNSKVDHPMHLHGHFFQVLSKDGNPLTGAPIIKDTLMVKPGEKFEVAFKADNTGKWIQHCHELHHATAGMMQGIEYTDFKSNYTPNPGDTFNKPE